MFSCLLLIACGGGDEGGNNTPSGGNEYLNVSNVDIPGGNTTATLYINASQNCEWLVTWTDSWIRSINPTKGRGSQNVSINVSQNPSSTATRTAAVRVSNISGTIVRDITISQSPNAESLELSMTAVNFTYSASSQDINVTSNTHWTVNGSASWMMVSKTEGDNNGSFTISVVENPTEIERSTVLTIEGTGGLTKQLTVTQTGHVIDLNVSPTSITTEAISNKVQFNIVGNVQWRVTSDKDWTILSDNSGEDNKTIIVDILDNVSEEVRTAEITVSSSFKSVKVVITQKAATKPVISNMNVTDVNRTEASINFSYTSMFPVTEYGVCYSSEQPYPTISDKHTTATGESKSGSYSTLITELKSGTKYRICAYAISAVGITYSNPIEVTTTQGEFPNVGDNPQPGW